MAGSELDSAAAWAGVLALGLTGWQVVRDLLDKQSAEKAQARVALTLIVAIIGTYEADMERLCRALGQEQFTSAVVTDWGKTYAANEVGKTLLSTFLSLDVTKLPRGAQQPVYDAQADVVGLFNNLSAIGRGERSPELREALCSRIERLKQIDTKVRGYAPKLTMNG